MHIVSFEDFLIPSYGAAKWQGWGGREGTVASIAHSKKEVWVSGPEGGMNHEPRFTASGVSTA